MVKRVLIVKTSALGDVVQAFSVLELLHSIYPGALIDWIAEKPSYAMLKAHPLINQVYQLDSKVWKKDLWANWNNITTLISEIRAVNYDILFDFQANMKSGLINIFSKAVDKVGFTKKFCAEGVNTWTTTKKIVPTQIKSSRSLMLDLVVKYTNTSFPELSISPLNLNLSYDERHQLENIRDRVLSLKGPVIAIAPFSRWENKQLSDVQIRAICNRIYEKYCGSVVFIVGSQKEAKQAKALKETLKNKSFILEPLPIPVLQNLFYDFSALISVDSFPLHLAATTTLPIFSLFGPSSNTYYSPKGSQHDSLMGSCPYHKKFHKRCKMLRTCPTGLCIKMQDAEDVSIKVVSWLSSIQL